MDVSYNTTFGSEPLILHAQAHIIPSLKDRHLADDLAVQVGGFKLS